MSEQSNNEGSAKNNRNPDEHLPKVSYHGTSRVSKTLIKVGTSAESTIIVAPPLQAANPHPPPVAAANDPANAPATLLSTMPPWLYPTGAKRRPDRRQGDKYDLKDNGDDKVDRTKAVVGPPDWEKLRLILTTTRGTQNTYIFKKFEGTIPDSRWKDPAFIAMVNKWKDQVLRRTKLMEKSPKGGVERRTKYTEKERDHLHNKLKKLMRKTGTKPSGEDWEIIAKEHDQQWQGKIVKVGEKLVNAGKRATTETEIVRRSIPSLKIPASPAVIRSLQAQIAAESQAPLAAGSAPLDNQASVGQQEDQEESQDEYDEGDDTEDDGEDDLGLEEDSEDEMGGQRPASNTTGGILVATS